MARTILQPRRGQSLIGLLLSVAIILILAAIFFPRVAAEHSQPGEPRTPLERAHGAACATYQSQLNEALEMYKTDHDDQLPRHIEALKQYGVTDDQIYADGCYFVIDPQQEMVVDKGLSQVNPQQAPDQYYARIRAHNRSNWFGGDPPRSGFHPDDPQPTQAAYAAGSAGTGDDDSAAPTGGGGRHHRWRYNSGGGPGGQPNGGPDESFANGPAQYPGGGPGQGYSGAPPPPPGGANDDSGSDDGGGGDMNLRPTPPPRIGPGGIPLPTAGY